MKKSFLASMVLVLFAMLVFPAGASAAPEASVIPTISIVSVVRNETVTIRTHNFPAGVTFNVYMNTIGTRGIGGTLVDTFASGSGGSFTRTFNIPSGLQGLRQIAIRLQSPSSGYYAYNWFYNNTTGGQGGIPSDGQTGNGYTGFPRFSITGVVRNQTVTVHAYNLPANDTFNVRMGLMGTRGVGGYLATSVSSGDGGEEVYTFNIPAELAGSYRISIRMESPGSDYFAYNWFYNNTTP